jgi:hypothetical protein
MDVYNVDNLFFPFLLMNADIINCVSDNLILTISFRNSLMRQNIISITSSPTLKAKRVNLQCQEIEHIMILMTGMVLVVDILISCLPREKEK